MSVLAELPFPDLELPEPSGSLRDDAEAFCNANPGLMAWLAEQALRYRRAGYPRIGIARLIEGARWEIDKLRPDSAFRINNSHRAYIARRLMADYPELDGFFEIRRVRY